ncbi:MAG TPA: formate/nitrite transporter family protein [Tepidisphaeraceae bacterium]|nr:formate/nitrite transporter family protein [Tepidisphaeraceae bacterium]
MTPTQKTGDGAGPRQERQQNPDDQQSGDEQKRTEEEEWKKKDEEYEHQEVLDKSAASAHVVYRAILREAEEELERPSIALAWSGLAAGMSMGFSLVADGLLQSRLPDTPWRDLLGKLGYTLGFVILILGRQQLFTENTLTPVLSLLKQRDARTFGNTARLWGVVLLTNLIGAALVAYILERSDVFSHADKAAFLRISSEAMEPYRITLFFKAIFAGWLIATMVWMLPEAESARIWVLVIIPYVVGLGGLSHIIIGSIYCIYTVAAHQHTWWEYFSRFAWPVLLGNCLGGVALVAFVNYAQATAGSPERGGGARGETD